MQDKFKIGIIGLKRLHSERLNLIKKHFNQIEIIASSSTTNDDLLFAKNDEGISYTYEDHKKLTDNNELDAILVWSDDLYHAKHAILAIESNKNVFVDLPMSTNVGDGKEMIEAARKRPSQITYAPIKHLHNPIFQKANEIIESGLIGTPVMAQVFQSNRPKPHLNDRLEQNNRNLFLDTASETIGILQWLMGKNIISVKVLGAIANDKTLQMTNDVDVAQVQVRLADNCFAQFSFSRVSQTDSLNIIIQGSKANLVINHSGLFLQTEEGTLEYDLKNHFQYPFANELSCLSSFVHQISTRGKSENSLEEALSCTEVAVAMARSLLMKETIDL